MKKPENIQANGLRGYAKRPRPASGPDDGRWLWQFGSWVDRKWKSRHKSGYYTRDEALRILLDLPELEEPAYEGQAETMEDLFADWLEDQLDRVHVDPKKGTLSQAAYENYGQRVNRALPHIGSMRIKQFGQRQMELLRDRLLQEGRAISTTRTTLDVVNMAWSHGIIAGYGPTRPLPRVRLPEEDEGVYNQWCPEPEEAAKVFDLLPEDTRIRLAYLLIWFTGARITECTQLKWPEVDLLQGTITLRRKGKKGRKRVATLDLHPVLLAELRAHAEGKRLQGLVIQSISVKATGCALRRAMRRACAVAKVPRFTPHGLRRLASTLLIEANVSPKVYESVMGHRFEEGMKTYAKARRKSQVQAVALLGPKAGQLIQGPWKTGTEAP